MFSRREILKMAAGTVVAAPALSILGCGDGGEAERASPQQPVVIDEEFAELYGVIALDTSGSYSDQLLRSGKGFRLICSVVDKMWKGRVGQDDRLLIVQLSANQKALLWEGSPAALRKTFNGPDAFRNYVLARSNPNGSPLYAGLSRALSYALNYPGVAAKQTRVFCCACTDMDDNDPDGPAQKEKFLKELVSFQKAGGAVGLYGLEPDLLPEWRANLLKCGFSSKTSVCESSILEDPKVPTFDD